MNEQEVYNRLQGIFDVLFMEPVKLTANLTAKQVPEWDSLIQISLTVAVEKEFGIRFVTGEVAATRNVGDFVALIQKRLSA